MTVTAVAVTDPAMVASAVGVERLIATAPATPVAVFTAVPFASAESVYVFDACTVSAAPATWSEAAGEHLRPRRQGWRG